MVVPASGVSVLTTGHRAQRPRRSHVATIAVLGGACFMFSAMQATVLPALATFQHSLHTSVDGASWILTAYLLSASVATPIIGRLGDMYGKDRLFVYTLLVVCAGTVLGALGHSIAVVDLSRVIQGVGAGLIPLSFGIARDEIPTARLPGALGVLSASIAVGGGSGIVLGGVILTHFDWPWLFWFPLIPTGLAALLAFFALPRSPVRTPSKINWISAVLMAVGLCAVLLGVSEATSWGWGSARTQGAILGGLAVCAAWVWWEVRSPVALVDMRLMRLRSVWTLNLAGAMFGAGQFAIFVVIPGFVEAPRSTGYGFGSSVIGAGLFLVPQTLAMLVMSLQAGRIARRFGPKSAVIGGTAVAAASFIALLVAHDHEWNFYAALSINGLGFGLVYAALANLVVEAVPRTHTGVASGMNTVMRTGGGALGSAIAATLIAASTVHGEALERGYVSAMAACAAMLVLAILASVFIPGRIGAGTVDGGPALGVQARV